MDALAAYLPKHIIHVLKTPSPNTWACVVAFAATPLAYACWQDYQTWRAVGPGGLPYNAIGWLVNWAARCVTNNDVFSTACYMRPAVIIPYAAAGHGPYLPAAGLPARRGERPEVALIVAPHRQRPGNRADIRKLQQDEFEQIAGHNSHLVQVQTSLAEKQGPALFVRDKIKVPEWATSTKGEIAHIHGDAEGSSHVTLSLADAKEVLEKGWGQRHRLSGSLLPLTFVMIYAPRDEEEVKVMSTIFKASIGVMTCAKDVV